MQKAISQEKIEPIKYHVTLVFRTRRHHKKVLLLPTLACPMSLYIILYFR